MKIAHIVISGSFSEGMTYQENLLPLQNAKDGHEVIIVASTLSLKDGRIVKVPEHTKRLRENMTLIRIEYDKIINRFLSEKIRKSSKLMPIIYKFDPDIIFLHGCQVYEILNIARYRKRNKNKKLIVDMHSDFNNSARNTLSYLFLHKMFYRILLKIAGRNIDKMFCINEPSKMFLQKMYGYNINNVEILPLGGLINSIQQEEKANMRKELGIRAEDIVFAHAGKINEKKKTKELLEIFNQKSYANMKLIIIGNIEESYEPKIRSLLEKNIKKNVLYLGWKSGYELLRYLSISDVYIQPGSASVLLQNAICAGNAIITANKEIYSSIVKRNGWIIENIDELGGILDEIYRNPSKIEEMKMESLWLARQVLDYSVLAKRIYEVRETK